MFYIGSIIILVIFTIMLMWIAVIDRIEIKRLRKMDSENNIVRLHWLVAAFNKYVPQDNDDIVITYHVHNNKITLSNTKHNHKDIVITEDYMGESVFEITNRFRGIIDFY